MRDPITPELRQQVAQRADYLCEYCLLFEDDAYFGCHVDHIISVKHGGQTALDNLAYACAFCNRAKGSDVGSVIMETGEFVRFYNPRRDVWADHFRLDGVTIYPKTDIGLVTATILQFNREERLLERQTLQAFGAYPSFVALKYIF
jgi:hypothetical protein